MASSSSSSVQQKYQVFLSFRGEDTRNNFTSHLHEALKRKGIDTYVDYRLEKGDEISEALVKAIEESKISIIVLSKNYASSSWCLNELSKILECKERMGHKVIPIFYHVDPSDVRKQTGSFKKAFEKQQRRFKDRTDKVEKWRAAFVEVAGLAGHHLHGQPNDRSESKHIKDIVEDISKKLIYKSPNDFEGLVGIDSHMKEIESLLCFELADVRILGIWGMGGIGKTTVAEAIFHRISTQFEGRCFLANVREKSKKCGWICVRDELLCEILEERNINVGTSLLPTFVLDRLRRKKVFIVLDDVDDSMQLDLLLKKHCFGLGSRIIVTSRDKQVLRHVVDEMYEVKGLNDDKALKLFSLCAFKQSHPIQDFMEFSNKVVYYAKGVPLALKVLGSSLYGRSKLDWEGDLNKLKKIPNPRIDNILRISYDGLDHEVQDIFLDISCFFKGMGRVDVTNILDGCYISATSAISVLIDKSLITISRNNELEMHDLLQQMGTNIVCQESKELGECSRLWNPEYIYHVLKNNTGTGRVTGMFLDMSKIRDVHLSPEAFARMYNLKFLKFYYSGSERKRKVYLSQQRLESLSDNLSYLHWDGYPSKSLPSFCPENLVELRMPRSHLKKLWNGVQNLVKLKTLDLSYSRQLIKIPDLSRVTVLERMMLTGCTSLVEVPSSIQYLNKLEFLCLSNCQNLGNFPSNIHLKSLKTLSLNNCSNLIEFPEISGNLENLYLNGTAIEEVPSSIKCLSRLKYLNLEHCKRLRRLPSSICKLKFLKNLNLTGCLKLESFPEILETMECLVSRSLSHTSIKELPSSIECLSALEELYLDNCEKLNSLPRNILKLKSLRGFRVSGFSKLEVIEELLETVQKVNVCPSIGTAKIDFEWSKKYQASVSLSLSLNGLVSLRNNFGNMKSLQELSVSGFSVFDTFPDNVENLKSLKYLRLSSCNLFIFSSCLTCISSLRELDLSGNNFEIIPPSIKQLLVLERLDLSCCKRLISLPKLPPKLKYLNALDCISLEAVSGAFPTSCYWDQAFTFINCFNLNQNAILAKIKLHHEIQSRQNDAQIRFCFPGSEIPDWISYQNLGPSLTIRLPPHLHDHKFIGFALCVVVSFEDFNVDSTFGVSSNWKTNGGDCHYYSLLNKSEHPTLIGSDHVFLYYNGYTGERNYQFNEASFKFYLSKSGLSADSCMVKKCGVCVLYAEDDLTVFPHRPSESNAEESNPPMIQPSFPYDPTCLSLKCAVMNQDFVRPMVEDGTVIDHETGNGSTSSNNLLYAQPSFPHNPSWLSQKCAVICEDFVEPMLEDGITNKRPRNDY